MSNTDTTTDNNQETTKHTLMAIIAASTLCALLLAGWVGKSIWSRAQAERRAEIAMAAEKAERARLVQSFEDILNTLLIRVQKQALEYKKQRLVMVELTMPENLTTPDYVSENLMILRRTAPSLRGQMDSIMIAFENVDEEITLILADQIPETQAALMRQWKDLKTKHIQSYVDFFAAEDEMIDHYIALMELYEAHKEDLNYNADIGRITFKTEAPDKAQDEILARIKETTMRQIEILNNPPKTPDP